MATKPKVSKHRLRALDRGVDALRLRKAGASYQAIANRLGYASRSGAWHAVRAGLTATLQEPADELRGLELERLDALHRAVWDRAITGNGAAIDRALGIMRRRAALLGLDAPKLGRADQSIDIDQFCERTAAGLDLDVQAQVKRILETGR